METQKLARLDALLADRDLDAVWFARPNSFAWLTGGDNLVDASSDVGVAAVGYDGDEVLAVTNDIEAERLRDEELPDGVAVDSFEWHALSLADAVAERSPTPAAADFDVPGLDTVDPRDLRQPLTGEDVEAYRSLSAETAAIVEDVCEGISPADVECDVAAALRERFARRGISAPVVLVGSAERAQKYRHYTTQDAEIGEYALVSVTVERAGLHVSLTRSVAFDPPSWFRDRFDAAARVQAAALAATQEVGREGGTAGDVFAAVQEAYDAVGWEGEWREHHQGGAGGYSGREWIATPDHDAPVFLPMGYSWNPTVQGAKSENTWLVTDDEFECLTRGDWETETYDAPGFDVSLPITLPRFE